VKKKLDKKGSKLKKDVIPSNENDKEMSSLENGHIELKNLEGNTAKKVTTVNKNVTKKDTTANKKAATIPSKKVATTTSKKATKSNIVSTNNHKKYNLREIDP
jgi:hypothetical protein